MNLYDEDFYKKQFGGSVKSAEKFLSKLFGDYKPSSVIDFGCGVGSWLYAAEKLGVTTLVGLDGEWVDSEKMLTSSISFEPVDFETTNEISHFCDLAISVEVAEHFDGQHADNFIRLISRSSDLVIFGAAIPFQGGTHHVNEQPQSYWIKKFADAGFSCFDYFRPSFWNDKSVELWYRQNTFLFVRTSNLKSYPFLDKHDSNIIADAVHPELFSKERKINRERADILRDAAIELEHEDIELAFLLISKAKKARPDGNYIIEKYRDYLEALKNK